MRRQACKPGQPAIGALIIRIGFPLKGSIRVTIRDL